MFHRFSCPASDCEGGTEKSAESPAARPKVPLYVASEAQLEQATADDRRINLLAMNLVERNNNATIARGVTVLLGLGAGVAVAFMETGSTFERAAWGAGTTALVTGVLLWAFSGLRPDKADIYDVINEWNSHHPDRPLSP